MLKVVYARKGDSFQRSGIVARTISFFALLSLGVASYGVNFIWTNPNSGKWGVGTNWGGAPIGNATSSDDAYINFSPYPVAGINLPHTVTLDGWGVLNPTVGRILSGSNLALSGTTLTLSNPGSVVNGNVTFSGNPTITGTGSLTVSGLISLSGGMLSGTGKITANGGLAINYALPGASLLKPMDLYGDSFWNSGSIYGGTPSPLPVVTNYGIFTINAQSGATWNDYRGFVNAPIGDVIKAQPTTVNIRMGNDGDVFVNDGTLEITNQSGSDSHSGNFSIASGATLAFLSSNRLLSGASVSGLGTLRTVGDLEFAGGSALASPTVVNSGAITFRSGATISSPASISNSNGSTNFDAGGSYNLASASFGGFVNAVNGPMSVGLMSVNGGILNGSGQIAASGTVTLTGGTLSGTGKIRANAGLNIQFPAGGASIAKPMDLYGTSNWNTGIIFGSSANPIPVVTNFGTFNINSTSNVTWDTARNFVNASTGTVNKNQSTSIPLRMANNGLMNINQGTLEISNVSGADDHSGDFVLSTGATLRLLSSNRLVNGSSVTGPGALLTNGIVEFGLGSSLASATEVSSGTTTFQSGSVIALPASISNSNGSTNFDAGGSYNLASASFGGFVNAVNGPMSVGLLSVNGGILNGSGQITASGLVTLTGGTLSGTGKIIANAGLNIQFPAGGASIAKPMDLYGTSNWNSGTIFGSAANPVPVVTNHGTFNINSTSNVTWDTSRNFVNASTGTVNKFQTTNVSTFLTNSGIININAGTLSNTNGAAEPGHSGIFNLASGSNLSLANDNQLLSGSRIQGAGKLLGQGAVEFQSGSLLNADLDILANSVIFRTGSSVAPTTDILVTSSATGSLFEPAGSYNLSSLTIQGGTNSVNGPLTVGSFSISGGTFDGIGATTVTGPLTMLAGMMNGTGSITAQSGINISGSALKNMRKPMILQGISSWTDGSVSLDPTGTVNLQGSMNISNDGLWDRGTFTNNGTVNKTAGLVTSSTRFASPDGNFINDGTVNVQSGRFQVQTDLQNAPGQIHSGTFNLSGGTELIVQGSTQFGSGAKVQGLGRLNQVSRNSTFLSGSQISSPILITGGALRMQTGSTFVNSPKIDIPSSFLDGVIIATGTPQTTGPITGSPNAYLEASSNITVNGALLLNGRMVGPGNWNVTGLSTIGSVPVTGSSTKTALDPGGSFTASGGLTIGNGTNGGLDFRRPLILKSSSHWAGAPVFSQSSVTTEGTLNISGSGTWNGGSINNPGSITKTSGTGTSTFDNLTGIVSNGSLVSSSGTLAIKQVATNTGFINGVVNPIAANSSVLLQGNYDFRDNTRIFGDGRTVLESGTMNFLSGSSASGGIDINNSIATFNAGSIITQPVSVSAYGSQVSFDTRSSTSLDDLRIENSIITSSNDLSVDGKTTFVYGVLTSTTNNFNGGVDFIGPLDRVLNNNTFIRGSSLWSGGTVTVNNGAIITQEGTMTINGGDRWSGRHVFSNKGAIIQVGTGKTDLAYSGTFSSGVFTGSQFSNSGSVSVQAGELRIGGFGSHTGTFVTSSGAKITFDSPQNFRSGSISGTGEAVFSNGKTEFLSGSSLSGDIKVTGGTVTFNAGSSANLSPNFTQDSAGTLVLSTGTPKNFVTLGVSSGQFSGNDPINVSSLTTLTGGNLGGSGLLTASGGISISGVNKKTLSKNIISTGVTQWSGGVVEALGGTFANSGTLNMNGDLIWNWGQFNNTGTIKKTTGTGIGYIDADVFTNSGVIEVQKGTLRIGNLSNLNLLSGQLVGGVYRVLDGQTLQISSLPGSIIGNGGVIELVGPNSQFNNLNDTNSLAGLMTNSGSLVLQDGRSLQVPNGFTNTGNLTVGTGSSLTSTGTITLQSGTVTLNGSISAANVVIAGGQIAGSGQMNASVTNNLGELSPGPGVSVLDINGSYSQGPLGRVKIGVQGPNPQDHDVINISENLTLNGQLVIELIPFLPVPAGTRLRIINVGGTISGNFSIPPPTSEWTVDIGQNYVDIVRVGSGQSTYPFSGRGVLQGWRGGNPVRGVNLEFFSGQNLVVTQPITPLADLLFSYNFQTLLQGTYTVRTKCPGYLDHVFPVTISLAGASSVDFILTPGDADENNEVGPGDFELVVAKFGASSTDPDYSVSVDFDGDGEIGPSDFEAVTANFGMEGDHLP